MDGLSSEQVLQLVTNDDESEGDCETNSNDEGRGGDAGSTSDLMTPDSNTMADSASPHDVHDASCQEDGDDAETDIDTETPTETQVIDDIVAVKRSSRGETSQSFGSVENPSTRAPVQRQTSLQQYQRVRVQSQTERREGEEPETTMNADARRQPRPSRAGIYLATSTAGPSLSFAKKQQDEKIPTHSQRHHRRPHHQSKVASWASRPSSDGEEPTDAAENEQQVQISFSRRSSDASSRPPIGAIAVAGLDDPDYPSDDQSSERSISDSQNAVIPSISTRGMDNQSLDLDNSSRADHLIQAVVVEETSTGAHQRDIEALQDELAELRGQPRVHATIIEERTRPSTHLQSSDRHIDDTGTPKDGAQYRSSLGTRSVWFVLCGIFLMIILITVGVIVGVVLTNDDGSTSSNEGAVVAITSAPTPGIVTSSPSSFPSQPPTPEPSTATPSMIPTILAPFQYDSSQSILVGTSTLLSNEAGHEGCWELCSDLGHVASSFIPSSGMGGECSCFLTAQCLAPFDDNVAQDFSTASLTYSQLDIETCSQTLCEIEPSHYLCYTNQAKLNNEEAIHGDTLKLIKQRRASDETDCLRYCAGDDVDAVKYLSEIGGGDNCFCYAGMECFLPWAPQVSGAEIAPGKGFIKRKDQAKICDFTYCDRHPLDPLCFTGYQRDLTEGTFLLDPMNATAVKSKDTNRLEDCLEFCIDSFAVEFTEPLEDPDSIKDEPSCLCFDSGSIDCMLPWGSDRVGADFKPKGRLLAKSSIDTCPTDHCHTFPTSPYCFTGNTAQYKEQAFTGDNLQITKSTELGDLGDCLRHCSDSFAVMYTAPPTESKDNCVCYDNVDCLRRWGPNVNTEEFDDAQLFMKDPVNECLGGDYCDVNPDDYLCFTNNVVRQSRHTIYGDNMQVAKSVNATGLTECMQKCAEHDAVSFDHFDQVPGPDCTCYDNVQCKVRWGAGISISTVPAWEMFSKTSLPECPQEGFCDIWPDDYLCFTGRRWSRDFYSLYGQNMTQSGSTVAENEIECLRFCEGHEGVDYIDDGQLSSGPNCRCMDDIQCRLDYNFRIDKERILDGRIFLSVDRDPCPGVRFCDLYPSDPLCVQR